MRNPVSLIAILISFVFISCENYPKNASHQQVSNGSIGMGKKLAAQYCASCHQLPDPSLANADSWQKGILPEMGPRLGIFFYGYDKYPSFKSDLNVDRNYYPSSPVIPLSDWQHIIDYYTATSPDSLLPATPYRLSRSVELDYGWRRRAQYGRHSFRQSKSCPIERSR